MLYGVIRLLITGVFCFCFSYFLRGKDKNVHIVVKVLLCAMLLILISLIPFENMFYTFDTAEDAFFYYNTEDIALIADGENSSLVIGKRSDVEYVINVIYRSSGGWKIGMGYDVEIISEFSGEGYVVYIYRYSKTGEHYAIIHTDELTSTTVNDSLGTTFYEYGDGFCGYISLWGEGYEIYMYDDVIRF